MHGYVPHHTQEYLARQALNRKERVAREASKAVSNQSRGQQVLPNASSSVLPPAPKLPEVVYHDDFWKMPVDVTHLYAQQPLALPSQDVPLSLPFETWPGFDTPNTLQHFPSAAQSPLSLVPSDFTFDYYPDLHGPQPDLHPQLYTMQPQEQQFGESLTGDYGMPPYNGNGQWNWLQQQ